MAKYCIWESRLFLSSGLYKQVLGASVQKHMSDLISSPSICVLLLMSGSHMAFPLSLRINIFIKTCLHNSVVIYFPGTVQASFFFFYSKLLGCKIHSLPPALLLSAPPEAHTPRDNASKWILGSRHHRGSCGHSLQGVSSLTRNGCLWWSWGERPSELEWTTAAIGKVLCLVSLAGSYHFIFPDTPSQGSLFKKLCDT